MAHEIKLPDRKVIKVYNTLSPDFCVVCNQVLSCQESNIFEEQQ